MEDVSGGPFRQIYGDTTGDQRELEHKRWLDKHAPKAAIHSIARVISRDPDNAEEALQLLGIASPNPEHADRTPLDRVFFRVAQFNLKTTLK
jgi:hypothetical protein